MSAQNTVYLNLREITELHKPDIQVKDVAEIYCSDTHVQNRCASLKIKTIREQKRKRYVENALNVIRILEAADPSVTVNNVGKVEFIIDYQPRVKQKLFWQWCKTMFVCMICFCGAAFAIMTFNNDVSVTDAFYQIYLLVTGTSSDGFTILEISYSIGLGLGIVVFFNHFAHWKITTDPTPLEVEMRLYEENVCKTLIQNAGRKESGVDVS